MALFEIKNLTFSYPNGKRVLNNINLKIEKGDFVLLCGATGSGKTTLLRLLKPEISPLGEITGEVNFENKNIKDLTVSESSEIGFMQQNADHQIVTDKVWHEVAFGMENLGFSPSLMKRRLSETMAYLGIDRLFDCKVNSLSGGEKQLVSLASILAMGCETVILDEPTSQLDPIAAYDFMSILSKINKELGITVIITEHRVSNVLPLCNKICILDEGEVKLFAPVQDGLKDIIQNKKYLYLMPDFVRLFSFLNGKGECPVSINHAIDFITGLDLNFKDYSFIPDLKSEKDPAVKLKNVSFRYSQTGEDILNLINLEVMPGEALCILGQNGSGKTTLLKTISGLLNFYNGKVEILGKNIKKYKGQSLYNNLIAMMPQNPETMFLHNTLKEEFEASGIDFSIIPYDLSYAANSHPYDLSGGEKQLAALCKVLSASPKILLLDEPTKGLDLNSVKLFSNVIKSLKNQGITLICVTHDVEFAALCSDRCAMLFRGEIVCNNSKREFFENNLYYTTCINKVMNRKAKGYITLDDVKEVLGGVNYDN